jgi:flagellar protein FliO/FliZ
MQNTWTSVAWFIAIVALIPIALWLLKRTPLANGYGGGGGRAGTPRTVAVLPLSAQQKLVTVEVGQGDDRLWLVLGVSPQGIRTLHTMAAQAAPAEAVPPPSAAFAQLLSRLRGESRGESRGEGGAGNAR